MFTEKYIKMAEQAKEIQESWKPEVGDWYCYRLNPEIIELVVHGVDLDYLAEQHKDKWYFFLPLQHQLQEMCKRITIEGDPIVALCVKSNKVHRTLKDFYKWSLGDVSFLKLESIEELMLAYVMEKKYQKKWNNTKGVWE